MKNKFSAKKLLVFLLLLFIIFELASLTGRVDLFKSKPMDFSESAKKIVEKCKSAPYKPSCYDKEIPKLMDKITMEDAFSVTKNVQRLDTSYAYCHVLGHELAAREVRKDPKNWKDVITRCPSGVCSNGCLHGGLQEKFRGAESLTDDQVEKLVPDLQNLCEPRGSWNPTRLEQASCYHALGHLNMYAVAANIEKALPLCERIALKPDGADWRVLCYDGVFMQMFQPLEPEDFALIKGREPTRDNVDAFCDSYEGKPRASCISESWPLFIKDILNDPNAAVALCNKSDIGDRARCLNAIFYVLTSRSGLDSAKMSDYCARIEKGVQPQCFANAASRMIETDYQNIGKAIKLCNDAKEFDPEGACFDEMVKYSTYNFHPESKEYYEICNSLPQKWKEECLSRG